MQAIHFADVPDYQRIDGDSVAGMANRAEFTIQE
jgi:hypothetical protein